jgi:polar amino acid transport system substrate-binding protein
VGAVRGGIVFRVPRIRTDDTAGPIHHEKLKHRSPKDPSVAVECDQSSVAISPAVGESQGEALGLALRGGRCMKRSKATKRIIVAILLGVFLAAPSVMALTVKLAFIDTDAVPFKWKKNGAYVGPLIDIVKDFAYRIGVDVERVPLPPKRIDAYLQSGEVDGAFGISKRVDRETIATYLTTPIGALSTNAFVVKNHEFSYSHIEDLYGKRVGVVRGIVISKAFEQGVDGGKIVIDEANSYESLLKMLLSGRVNIVVSPAPVFQYHIDKMHVSGKVVKLPIPVRPNFKLYIAIANASKISKKPNLIKKMNTALQNMADENRIEKIYMKYGYPIKLK